MEISFRWMLARSLTTRPNSPTPASPRWWSLSRKRNTGVPTSFGAINTDRYERAFVDRIVSAGNDESLRKFAVYFLQKMAGSPEQITATQPQSMVCLSGVWYYLPSQEARRTKLGKWQTLHVAGPTLRARAVCLRTTAVRDADGFTIERPQTELIVGSDPHTVRTLVARVHLGGSKALSGTIIVDKRVPAGQELSFELPVGT